MLDRYLAPLADRALQPLARQCVRAGISADAITIAGFVIGLLAVPAIALEAYWSGLALIALNRILDGLDGAVARLARPTERGAFLDIALDFFFYAAIPLGFALADPQANALAAAIVLVSFVGTGSSFLAFSAVAEKAGTSIPVTRGKGIRYLGGLTEGTETILFFVLICLLPHLFAQLALIFAGMALLTTIARWWWGWQVFSQADTLAAPLTDKSQP